VLVREPQAVIGLYNCLGGFLALPIGSLSDHVGRRPVALLAMAMDLSAYHLHVISMAIESLDWLRFAYAFEIGSSELCNGAGTTSPRLQRRRSTSRTTSARGRASGGCCTHSSHSTAATRAGGPLFSALPPPSVCSVVLGGSGCHLRSYLSV
jgi:MFS family permease